MHYTYYGSFRYPVALASFGRRCLLWEKDRITDRKHHPFGGRWLFENNMAWAVKIFAVGGALALMGVCIHRRPRLAPVAYIPLVVYGLIAVYHAIILVYPYIF